jgi:hypothetical protein
VVTEVLNKAIMQKQLARKAMQVETAVEEARAKRPQVGVNLGYPLYDEVQAAAAEEPVKLSAFVLEVFRYGFRVYQQTGSLKTLKAMESAGTMPAASKRVSAETARSLVRR